MTMRLGAIAAVLAFGFACGGGDAVDGAGGSAEAGGVDVEAVAQVARAIKADPAAAEAALQSAGFTRKSFEEALYTIAEDPKLTVKYAKLLQAK